MGVDPIEAYVDKVLLQVRHCGARTPATLKKGSSRIPWSVPTPAPRHNQRDLRKVNSTPALRQRVSFNLADASSPPTSTSEEHDQIAREVRFTPPISAVGQSSLENGRGRDVLGSGCTTEPQNTTPGGDFSRPSTAMQPLDQTPPPKALLGWQTPKGVQIGADGILRKAQTPAKTSRVLDASASKPMLQKLPSPAATRAESRVVARYPRSASATTLRTPKATGGGVVHIPGSVDNKPCTLTRLELGATDFGIPRWEPPHPIDFSSTADTASGSPSGAPSHPANDRPLTQLSRAQAQDEVSDQSRRTVTSLLSNRRPLKAWVARGQLQAANREARRWRIEDDALSWLEIRTASGAFSLAID